MIAFLHFYGAEGADGFLDVDYRAPIEYRKATFGSAAHLLVSLEARFYGDVECEARARFATSPKVVQAVAKAIRRDVVLERAWQQQRAREIGYAVRLKFEQHPELAQRLLGTGNALLCYANPAERILGIGVADNHPNACQPHRWVGQNLLGLALTCVRAQLMGSAAKHPQRKPAFAV
jgi:ribA/ribD-fused uncharacterized protein